MPQPKFSAKFIVSPLDGSVSQFVCFCSISANPNTNNSRDDAKFHADPTLDINIYKKDLLSNCPPVSFMQYVRQPKTFLSHNSLSSGHLLFPSIHLHSLIWFLRTQNEMFSNSPVWLRTEFITHSQSAVWLELCFPTQYRLYRGRLWWHIKAAFIDVKVHYSPSLKVSYLSWRVKDAVLEMLVTKSLSGRNEKHLTEMAFIWSDWKCLNVRYLCSFIQAWQKIRRSSEIWVCVLSSVWGSTLYTPSLFIVSSENTNVFTGTFGNSMCSDIVART